jgi:hypothetical protein
MQGAMCLRTPVFTLRRLVRGSNAPVLGQAVLPRKELGGKPGFCVPGTQKCAHIRLEKSKYRYPVRRSGKKPENTTFFLKKFQNIDRALKKT